MGGGGEPDEELEAERLKSLAEAKFHNSNLQLALKYAKRARRLCPSLPAISEIITSLQVLLAAAKSPVGSNPYCYEILQVQPFSHINTIRKQYNKLALVLDPDKNTFSGSNDALKLVDEAFQLLSDRVRRNEYDTELRARIQAESIGGLAEVETFWTACSRCGSLHRFERRYLGNIMVCPSCKRRFQAAEAEGHGRESGVKVDGDGDGDGDGDDEVLVSSMGLKGKVGNGASSRKKLCSAGSSKDVDEESGDLGREVGGSGWSGGRLRRRRSSVVSVLKRAREGEEMTMTLAEMQLEAKRKVQRKNDKLKIKEKERSRDSKIKDPLIETGGGLQKCRSLENAGRGAARKRADDKEVKRSGGSENGCLEVMTVEDSDFYDFDKDRVERSFKQGQVWAVYDDDDGMSRLYGLIEQVISVNPFEVKMSWLDLQNSGDDDLSCWQKKGFHTSCGVFKVARKTNIDSLNIFSHIMACERAAKEVYRIYPTKGSVWALYNEGDENAEGSNVSVGDKRCYDIVVFLTTCSETHGLSMAYLEKVDGFKTVFRRREIGAHAIRWFQNDDVRLFSHQIPARKLSGEEIPDHLKDYWELDPASLPSYMLNVGWQR